MNNQPNLDPCKTEAERFLRQPKGTLPTNTANVVKRITTLESKVTYLEENPGGSTVEIVNDLTTGGATKALSAEQGKVLQDRVIFKNGGGSSTDMNTNVLNALIYLGHSIDGSVFEDLTLNFQFENKVLNNVSFINGYVVLSIAGSVINNSTFSHLSLLSFYQSQFNNCSFRGSFRTSMSTTTFNNCDFETADLHYSDGSSDADFINCNMRNANLLNVVINSCTGSDLSGVNIIVNLGSSKGNFTGAIGIDDDYLVSLFYDAHPGDTSNSFIGVTGKVWIYAENAYYNEEIGDWVSEGYKWQ